MKKQLIKEAIRLQQLAGILKEAESNATIKINGQPAELIPMIEVLRQFNIDTSESLFVAEDHDEEANKPVVREITPQNLSSYMADLDKKLAQATDVMIEDDPEALHYTSDDVGGGKEPVLSVSYKLPTVSYYEELDFFQASVEYVEDKPKMYKKDGVLHLYTGKDSSGEASRLLNTAEGEDIEEILPKLLPQDIVSNLSEDDFEYWHNIEDYFEDSKLICVFEWPSDFASEHAIYDIGKGYVAYVDDYEGRYSIVPKADFEQEKAALVDFIRKNQ